MALFTMAYLNVRERRLETKIAYVGPDLAGKATNLHSLKSDVIRGRTSNVEESVALVSLDWMPLQMPRFNDCDLSVRVVAARGELSSQRLREIFEDVDGVVLVVDAAADAQEENRRAVMMVKEALAGESDSPRPVILQANKSDLGGALGASALAATLETNGWPVVAASATRGDGVVETLEMALTNVIEAMKARGSDVPEVKADHNPLLTALRQILRDTVTEHMASLEAATVARVAARLDRTDEAIADLRTSFEAIRSAMEILAKENARALSAQQQSTAELASVTEHSLMELASLAGAVSSAREEAQTRAKADRDHTTSVGASIKRSVDGMGVDMKKLDPRDSLGQIADQLGKLHATATEMKTAFAPAAVTTAGLPARLATLETTLQRELRDTFASRLARIDDSVQVMQMDSGESFARSEARITEIHGGLTELLEELKKRKKGFFS